MTCYVNGNYFKENEASISPFDLGFLRGHGAFETFRTYHRHPHHLKEHVKRLDHSARSIGIELNESLEEIEKIIETLIENSPYLELTIRLISTKGITEDGITPIRKSSLIILTKAFNPFPDKYYTNGIRTITTDATRTLPKIKTLHYLPAILSLEKAKKQGCDEAIYVNKKQELLEGTRCNFFAFKEGSLITCNSDEIFFGYTRQLLLKKASSHFPIQLRSLHIDEIPDIEEAFITSSLKEIVPVVSIDDHPIGNGKPGPHTHALMSLFREVFLELALD